MLGTHSQQPSHKPGTRPEPERTCVGCRQARPKGQLLRLVSAPLGELRVDVHGKLTGRGAYCCPQRSCVAQIAQGGRLREALRQDVHTPSIDDLVRTMASAMEARVVAAVRMARKAGRVVSGYMPVCRALTHETVACLLIAEDTAPPRRRDYEAACATRQIPCRAFLTKSRLGELAGRDECSAIGILEPRLAARLLGYLEGMSRLTER